MATAVHPGFNACCWPPELADPTQVCATVALVDEADGSVKEQTYYHTG